MQRKRSGIQSFEICNILKEKKVIGYELGRNPSTHRQKYVYLA